MLDITEETIRELTSFTGEEPVTSCFLDVDGRRLLHQQEIERELDSVLRPARVRANGHSPGVSRDLDRIEAFVHGGFDRSNTRGLAIFSCSSPKLWKVVALPLPVRSRIVVNAQPAVGALKAMVERAQPLGVLLVDRQRTRMFVFALGELVEHSEQVSDREREIDVRGQAERGDLTRHANELVDHRLRDAAKLAFDVFQRVGFDRLVTNAPEEFVPRLREELHPYLRDRHCGRIAVTPTASTEEIRHAALELQERLDSEHGHRTVQRFLDGLGTGRAVEGLEATLAALGARRVGTLVVSEGFEAPGWRCGHCDDLSTKGRRCGSCGTEMLELHDVVEEAIEIALNASCEVESVTDDADLDVHGRIGGLLRY